jgi:hypothetical protein
MALTARAVDHPHSGGMTQPTFGASIADYRATIV